jgi:hypothetical protein
MMEISKATLNRPARIGAPCFGLGGNAADRPEQGCARRAEPVQRCPERDAKIAKGAQRV